MIRWNFTISPRTLTVTEERLISSLSQAFSLKQHPPFLSHLPDEFDLLFYEKAPSL
uniref:Uncharacterized protein n=1 Tax=Utricularia reniformis TaxID=192314 RepID=A0A1Y0B0W3_9LAMI|nr:hypothetical protein AEK19_MT0756 [Utricularia reniformis]ART30999.1 hypothetical protein AEK19_MT0756 [Utricularia reniformis]